MKLLYLLLLLPLFFGLTSCRTEDTESQSNVEDASTPKLLCGDCGHLKGTSECCAEGAESCGGCELHKGSAGCCKISKGTDAPLCGDCGQIKGMEGCCDADAETCTDCGLHKGSPGCCN